MERIWIVFAFIPLSVAAATCARLVGSTAGDGETPSATFDVADDVATSTTSAFRDSCGRCHAPYQRTHGEIANALVSNRDELIGRLGAQSGSVGRMPPPGSAEAAQLETTPRLRADMLAALGRLPSSTVPTRHARILDGLRLPAGFAISVFAEIPGARSLAIARTLSGDVVFVGTRGTNKVFAIPFGGAPLLLAEGLNAPNGVAFKDNALYVAEIDRVRKFDNVMQFIAENDTSRRLASRRLDVSFPTTQMHGWKFIGFGPDGKLYVPQGSPCIESCTIDDDHARIFKVDVETGNKETFARGVRNTVGFDWHPATGEMWFTDNGRDNMGDDLPPDELNRATAPGLNFGYPFCHGATTPDSNPAFGVPNRCTQFTPPALQLPAHVGALGMRFYRTVAQESDHMPLDEKFPDEYNNNIFIAEHGSWNRSSPVGARVTRVRFNAQGQPVYSTFIDGWLNSSGEMSGRPVDVIELSNGELLVSDDKAGLIYKVTRN